MGFSLKGMLAGIADPEYASKQEALDLKRQEQDYSQKYQQFQMDHSRRELEQEQKKALAEQQLAMMKLNYLPSGIPTDRFNKLSRGNPPAPGQYMQTGGNLYRNSPELAQQQSAILLNALKDSGGVGFGNFLKGSTGKNIRIGSDSPADVYKRGTDLRKEFTDLPLVKDYNLVNRQVKTMDSVLSGALKGDKDSKIAVDQALVMLYNKILDPTSVVRESEFARTPQGQSLINQFVGGVKKIEQGGVGLVNADRKALVNAAKTIADEYGNTFNSIYDSYADIAENQAKVPVENVLRGYKKHEGFSSKVNSAKKADYSEADIAYTMKKRNLSREEVLKRLGK